jgi:hypothetical protein
MELGGVVAFLVLFGGMTVGPEPARWLTSAVVRTAVPVAVTRYVAAAQGFREDMMEEMDAPPLPSSAPRRRPPQKPQDPLSGRR